MCSNIIIDRDVSQEFMKLKKLSDKKLNEAIKKGYFKVVYSVSESKWKKEISGEWKRRLDNWKGAGLAFSKKVDLSQPIKELKEFKRLKKITIKSKDFHILALAKVTQTNILYSNDGELREDFKNREIMGTGDTKLYPFKSNIQTIISFLNTYRCPSKN